MDFSSLGNGAPFYVLSKTDKPTLIVGVVKEKTAPQPRYQPQAVPNAFNGTQIQQVISITATIDGHDEVFSDLPIGIEIAARGDKVFSGSREAMLQHVDSIMQSSKKALEMVDYHKSVLEEGEKMIEVLNPRYADEKKQARTIIALEERQTMTDQKLATLEAQSAEMLSLLRQLNGVPTVSRKTETKTNEQ